MSSNVYEASKARGQAVLLPRDGDQLLSRLLDRNLALRFALAEALASSPLVPPASGFLAVRRPGRMGLSAQQPARKGGQDEDEAP